MKYLHYTMSDGPRFRLWLDGGDNRWARSLQLEYRWFGKQYWHVLFLN